MMISSNAKSRPLKKLFLFMEMNGQAIPVDGGLWLKIKNLAKHSKPCIRCLTVNGLSV
jgi:hypothetical protein